MWTHFVTKYQAPVCWYGLNLLGAYEQQCYFKLFNVGYNATLIVGCVINILKLKRTASYKKGKYVLILNKTIIII